MKATASHHDTKRLLSQKTVVTLLFLVVGLEVAALLIYSRLDNIIHGDLYRYGLNFNLVWANDYWMSNSIVIAALIGSIILTLSSLIPFYKFSKDCGDSSRWGCLACPVVAASFAAVSLLYVFHIDSLVHGTLYQYGLQFSQVWTESYWTVARTTLGLGEAAIVMLVITVLVTWVVTRDLAEERFQTQTNKNLLARTF